VLNSIREGFASISVDVRMFVCSDYGFELRGNDCVAASWFNASVPVETCEVGQLYHNSTGSVISSTYKNVSFGLQIKDTARKDMIGVHERGMVRVM